MQWDDIEKPVYKKYIDVLELRKKDGTLEPVEILWPDGRHFKIDRFDYLQYGNSRAGGVGKHYAVWIKGKRRDIYLEKDKWFIESHTAPEQDPLEKAWLKDL